MLMIAAESAPLRPEMTSSCVVLLMTFFVELYTMASRRPSAAEIEQFKVCANLIGSVICQRM